MIAAWIMRRMDWTDVWYVNPGPLGVWQPDVLLGGLGNRARWYVGVWTGPDNDLICVWHATTNKAAEAALSSSARTVTVAAIKAWRKRRRMTKEMADAV